MYESYKDLDFFVPVGIYGDCFDRFLIRLEEMKQSVHIIEQVTRFLELDGLLLNYVFDTKLSDYKIQPPVKNLIKNSMENLIAHFKLYSEGFVVDEEELHISAEAPKGEFGVYIESDNTNKPYRCKIRAPGYFHLQGLNFMAYNHLLADVVTIIGTQDIVFGEIDR